MEKIKNKRNPWSFIPTQYFAEGVPFVLVNQLSAVMYKSLQASNVFIGFTSFLYLPWSLKLFWAPLVDSYSTKRKWTVYMQLLLAAAFLILSLTVQLNDFLSISLIIFIIISFFSATHDIATDGFYLHALDKKDQALFTGIRSTFYRIAMIFAGGILVKIAGDIGESTGVIKHGWSAAFGISAALFFLFSLYHLYVLPVPLTDKSVKSATNTIPFKQVFKSYFKQERVTVILLFILLYRFGEGMIIKMTQPFLLDKKEAGGMAFSVSEVGTMYGTFALVALVIGGILGGWLVKKYGLKKLIWPMALSMNLPNLLYVYMAYALPDVRMNFAIGSFSYSLNPIVQSILVLEQFGYGLGFTAFTVYLLYISKGEFKTSYYAISTGIMAIGMMVPGLLSGILQQAFGYTGLFAISVLLGIPGMIPIFFLPFSEDKEE